METVLKQRSLIGIVLSFVLITLLAACVQVAATSEAENKEEKAKMLPDSREVSDKFSDAEAEPPKKSRKYKKRDDKKGAAPSQNAVDLGLDWLSRHQHPEGYWDCDGFDIQCKKSRCAGHGHALNDVGVTGMAVLAFLGAGNTPRVGPYKDTVAKAVKYLCVVQNQSDGCLTSKNFEHYMYNHGVASLALLECYGLSNYALIKSHAIKALDFIHTSKNPGKAWRYNMENLPPDKQNDVSVTTWMLLCLVSAKDFDLPYHQEDIDDGIAFINEMTDQETGRTGYLKPGSYSSREAGDELIWPFENVETLTAAGMMCRIFTQQDPNDEMLKKGAALLLKNPPAWDPNAKGVDYHYCYYGTNAMFQMGGDYWKEWKDKVFKVLLPLQKTEGCAAGSWDPSIDPWGDNGGRVYSTALCVLCLETFYRYNLLLNR